MLGERGDIICIHPDYGSSRNKDKVICFDHKNHKVGFAYVSAIATGVPKFPPSLALKDYLSLQIEDLRRNESIICNFLIMFEISFPKLA